MKRLIIGIFILISNLLTANEQKVIIITFDSLTGESLNDHYVYLDNKAFYYSGIESNRTEFRLNCDNQIEHSILVKRHNYQDVTIRFYVDSNCYDTIINVNLLYDFQHRVFPIFHYSEFDVFPDTNGLNEKLNILANIANKNRDLIFYLDIYSCLDEFDSLYQLSNKRYQILKDIIIKKGIDPSRLNVRWLGFQPYKIMYLEDINDNFSFKDVIDQTYIDKLPVELKPIAKKLYCRIEITVERIE